MPRVAQTKSRRLILAMVIGFAIAFAGCTGRAERRNTLTIALAVFPMEAAQYQVFVRDFAASHRVRVVLVAQTYTDILRALRAEGGAGRGRLDLVELDLSTLGEARDLVRPLDRIAGLQARTLFPPSAWQAASFGGHVYFVPHRLMWQAMIYNRIEVPRPPATWAELRDFVRRHPGKFALKGARYEGLICDAMPFVWDAGGAELAPIAPGSLAALDFLHELAPGLNPNSAVFREMSVLEAQARGEVWIHFNWPFAIGYLQSKGLAPQVDLSAPLPAGPGGGNSTPLGGGYLAIPRSAPHPELAAAFLQYLLAPEVQQKLSRAMNWYGSNGPPPGSDFERLYAGFTAMRPFVHARPPVPYYVELSDDWQRALREILFDDRDPVAAATRVAARIPAAMNSSQSR